MRSNNYDTILVNASSNKNLGGETYYRYDPRRAQQIPEPDLALQMQLYARDTKKNKATGYSDGPYMADSPLSQLYFSAENEQILQNGLRAGVYNKSLEPSHNGPPFILSQQNADALKAAMLNTYTMHYADRISPGTSVTDQVAEMNRLVLERIVPRLYSEACGYLFYLQSIDKPIQTQEMPMPIQYDRDWKQLELTPSQFF
jgi:hypothetical protein